MIKGLLEPVSYLTQKEKDMALNARSKGQRGEREIIDLLQPHVDEVCDFATVDRLLLQRNQMQSDRGGFDIVGLPEWAMEVKRVETDTPGMVSNWWAQSVRQAGKDLTPVLFYRMNARPWKVRTMVHMPLGEGRNYRVPADVSIDHFIFVMKARLHRHLTMSLTAQLI